MTFIFFFGLMPGWGGALPDDGAPTGSTVSTLDIGGSEESTPPVSAPIGIMPLGGPLAGPLARGGGGPTGSMFDAPSYGQKSLVKFVDIAHGQMGGIGLDSQGSVWTWGYNLFGVLGVGPSVPTSNYYGGMKRIPFFRDNGIFVTEIASAYQARYALGSNGKVYAWGQGANRTLGQIGSNANSNIPIEVMLPAGTFVEHIYGSVSYLGNNSCFALTSDNKLYGWGSNGSGHLGLGTTAAGQEPALVTLHSDFYNSDPDIRREIVKMSVGWDCAFILDDRGDLWVAGNRAYLGIGAGTGNVTTFTKMNRTTNGVPNLIDVSTGYQRTIILDVNHDAWEFGDTTGDAGRLVNVNKRNPVKIGLQPIEAALYAYTPSFTSVWAGEHMGYAIDQYGRVWSWGDGVYSGYGVEGNYEGASSTSPGNRGTGNHYIRCNYQLAEQWPKVIGDGDIAGLSAAASARNVPRYLVGKTIVGQSQGPVTVTAANSQVASTRLGYGFNDLHPTVYDEKYMLKDDNGCVLDAQGRTLKYCGTGAEANTSVTMTFDGIAGLNTGYYYVSSGGTWNRANNPAAGNNKIILVGGAPVRSFPAFPPGESLWIDLALQDLPFVRKISTARSTYTMIDYDGNIYGWGFDGSGSVAWGWDYNARYDQNGNLTEGLYDRYLYEVMYFRGSPTIDNINVWGSLEYKVYTEAGVDAVNPIDVTVRIPKGHYSDTLESGVYSDLNELKYVVIPYDVDDPDFNLNIGTLTASQFMDLYNAADPSMKGDLLPGGPVQSTNVEQTLNFTANAPVNGRMIIYAANTRYASTDGGVTREYVNDDPLFAAVLVDNVYSRVAMTHKGVGIAMDETVMEDPIYAPTSDNIVKTNNDAADTGKPLDTSLYGLPLDANNNIIGATKNPDGSVTVVAPPRFGYDSIAIKSYEVAPGEPITVTNYWTWANMYDGAVQPKQVALTMNDADYSSGYLHPFYYNPNANWTRVEGLKEWDDDDDKAHFRPTSITLTLKQYTRDISTGAIGTYIKDIKTITVTPNALGVWVIDFGGFYKSYEYTYVVEEDPIDKYTTEIDYGFERNGLTPNEDFSNILITNTLDVIFKPILFVKADHNGDAITTDTAMFALTNATAGGKVLDATETEQDSITLTTDASGELVVPKQLPGTYHLTETKAPAGYNLLTKPVVIVVNSDGTVEATLGLVALPERTLTTLEEETYAAGFKITNRVAADLPKAGGVGILMLLAGSVVITFSSTMLLKKKKPHRHE